MRRAFTLLETIVTNVIILLMLLAFSWMLLAGKASFQAGAARSASRQSADRALQKLARELSISRPSTLRQIQSPYALSFASAEDGRNEFQTDASGDPAWQKTVIYYVPPGRRELRRKEVATSSVLPLTGAQLLAQCNGGKLFLPDLQRFSIAPSPSGAYEVNIATRTVNIQGGAVQTVVQATVLLRN